MQVGRNLTDPFDGLPKRYRKQAHHLFSTALEQNSYKDAKKMLQEFERWLRGINESAADSLLEALEEVLTLLRGKRFLILDRDKKFTTEFRDLLEHAGTDVIRLPHRSPNLNAYVERFVLSIKSECLERMIFFSEPSLRRAVAEFIHHYHGERNHQGLGNALLEAEECVGSPHGKVRCRKRLGGLLSYYHCAAA